MNYLNEIEDKIKGLGFEIIEGSWGGGNQFVTSLVKEAKNKGIQLFIISHKTKTPYKGPKYDLHHAALTWLEKNLFFDQAGIDIPKQNIFFEETKEKKIRRIQELGCTHFIDDLEEILSMINTNTKKILYCPFDNNLMVNDFIPMKRWTDLYKLFN